MRTSVFEIPIENPDDGERTLVMNPASAASPLAWHNNGVSTFTTTQGNNVLAYTDRNADNLPDTGTQGLGFAQGDR